MSKIAEEKALEAYPIKEKWVGNQYGGMEDINSHSREKYQEGYDQAIQDFLDKACEWLSKNARNYYSAYATSDKLIEDFKNYMQDESEN